MPDVIQPARAHPWASLSSTATDEAGRYVVSATRSLAVLVLLIALGLQAGCSQAPVKSGTSPEQQVTTPPTTAPLTKEQQAELARAGTLVQNGKLGAAAETLSKLSEARPERSDLKARLAWIRQQQDQIDTAMMLYRSAIAANPANTMAVNNLALLLQRAGRFEQARAVLSDGLIHAPDAAELHYNLGVLSELYLLDLKTALTEYQRYQQLSGDDNHTVDGWIADLERRLK